MKILFAVTLLLVRSITNIRPVSAGLRGVGNHEDKGSITSEEIFDYDVKQTPTQDGNCPPVNDPVCIDGVTYQNMCLALNQGGDKASISAFEPCRGDKENEFDRSGHELTKADMTRFDEEGFKLVGKVPVHHGAPGEVELPNSKDKFNGVTPLGEEKRVTRATVEGLVYVAKNHKSTVQVHDTNALSGRTQPPAMMKEVEDDDDDGRKLAIIGVEDSRTLVSPYVWPNWRLAEMDWPPPPPSCMSGETRVGAQSKDGFKSVKDLNIGDKIDGLDRNMSPATCSVEAVGYFGNGPVFGNYTKDHFILDASNKTVHPSGNNGERDEVEKYAVLTSCPVGLDESGIGFTAVDSDFLGDQPLQWSDYVLIHQGILSLVKEVGPFVFSPSTYTSMGKVKQYTKRLYETMLKCAKDPSLCDDFENAAVDLVDNALTEKAKRKIKSGFGNIGKSNMPGSVAAAVSKGKSVGVSAGKKKKKNDSSRLPASEPENSEGGCSASIVGVNKVLTAAHCVYDAPGKKWNIPSHVAPGRYRSSTGSTIEPWGRWPVLHATVYTAWTNSGSYDSGDVKYDVAILTMGTNSLGNIGSHMGTLSVVPAPCTIDPNSRLTGYPADKADGEMWTSGICGFWDHSCNANTVYHHCDTTGGQSGSAIYDNSGKVFGVHSGGNNSRNMGYAFSSATKDAILSWGG